MYFDLSLKKIKVKLLIETKENDLPLIIYPSFNDDFNELIVKLNNITNKKFNLVLIYNFKWNDDLSPYFHNKIFQKGEDFKGNAKNFLYFINNEIINKVDENFINLNKKYSSIFLVGYSLAGLFATYSLFISDRFRKIASISGSLWFKDFDKFILENELINKKAFIYFSLGDKEEKSKTEVLKEVKNKTLKIKSLLEEKGLKTVYFENKGNHFIDSSLRVAKAIKYLLEN